MRAFVAIDVPPLEGEGLDGLRPEDHLTLHFFEELPTAQVPTVAEAMREAAAASTPLDLEVRGVGAFPSVHRPRVLWAGMGEGATALVALVARLRQSLTARRFPVERRPFVPHLTLLRLRSPHDAARARRLLAAPENASRVWTRATVAEMLLKESELLPTGARHTVRERVQLGPPSSGLEGP